MTADVTAPTTRDLGALLGRWGVPALWLTLPFTAGPAFADALDPRSRAVQLVASVGLWGLWAVALAAALVPRTTSLTVVRIIMPASVLAAGWALLAGPTNGVDGVLALGFTAAVTIAVLSAATGDVHVNGSAYGGERRMLLRPPAALLVGPLELAWLVCVAGAVAGPMLLAAQAWIAGGILLVVGPPAVYAAARALHGLSQRWIVFVPVGFVLHDLQAMSDPLLVPRRMIRSIGPALEGSGATDFTLGSLGLVLQVDLTEPTPAAPIPRRTRPGQRPTMETIEVQSLLFAPSRPGAMLREARARRFPVG
jgi:hypothetical protein